MDTAIKFRIKQIIWLLPHILMIALIPLFLYVKEMQISGIYYDYWTGHTVLYDVFTYYRSLLILAFSAILLILSILHALENHRGFKKSFILIPLMLYASSIILSIIISDYLSVALFGFNDRYEGGLILLAYILCCITGFNFINYTWDLKALLLPLIISSTILSSIGLFQFFGSDPFNTDFFRSLVFPKELDAVKEAMQIKGHVMYATLYNPNNVGTYASMLFPISLGLYWTSKKKKYTILLGLYACLMFAMWIGSRSRAGLVGASIAIALLLCLFRSTIWQQKRKFFIIIPFIIIFLVMNITADGGLMAKLNSLNPAYEKSAAENRTIRIKDIIFDQHHVQIISEANTLNLYWTDQKLTFTDQDQNPLTPVKSDEIFQFTEKPYDMYAYSIISEKEDRLLIELVLKNTKMPFYFEESGIYLVGTHFRTYNEIEEIPSFGFEGYEQFGSGRGYIWSRSLPLLKDTLWIGHGPDTFPMYYPQDDLIGKLNAFRDIRVVVDKPHSYYIQVAHNTGVVSLLALLALFGFYLVQSFKLYWKRHAADTWILAGKIIMGAVLGYLITSIFNDSVIYVAPIFWTLLGTGLAVNHIVLTASSKPNPSQEV